MASVSEIRRTGLPLENAEDLDPLVERASRAPLVIIGDACPGAHESHAWRAAITRRLIAEHGFGFVAVEADGPDCRRVDAGVRATAPADPADALTALRDWPSWPWSNTETIAFCRWLREHNATLVETERVGWYGLDAHPRHAALRTVVEYLRVHQPDYLDTALEADRPLVPREHLDPVARLLAEPRVEPYLPSGLYEVQNEKLPMGADGYYRVMLSGGDLAWNTRAGHMVAVLEDITEVHGPQARGVVWASSRQAADARATDLGRNGRHNLGEFARTRHSAAQVYTIGLLGGRGDIVAAPRYGADMDVLSLAQPRAESVEAQLLSAEVSSGLFFMDEADWSRRRHQRAVGLAYDAADEDQWLGAATAEVYDALCWFAETTPVDATHLAAARAGEAPRLR